jgi:hypothetical protein
MLIRITAPHFVAGIWNGEPAPILHYMRGWSVERIQKYANNKNWEIQISSDKPSTVSGETMADVIRGTIQQIPKPREFAKGDRVTLYYSMKVNDVYYSTGTKKPPAEGTLVEFEAEKNARGYWDVTKAGIRVIPGGAPSSDVGNAAVAASVPTKSGKHLSREEYWDRKDQRDVVWEKRQREVIQPTIELQAARNAAIEFVKLLITPVPAEDKDGNPKAPVTALKLGAQNKREQILFEAVNKYTEEFFKANQAARNTSENNNKNEQVQSSEDSSPAQSNREADSSDAAWDL